MERRTFILGLFALGAGSATLAASGKAEAAPALNATAAALDTPREEARAATLPDGTPIEQAQYRHPHGRPRRRQRRVCTVRRNRYGRPVRVCRTVWY